MDYFGPKSKGQAKLYTSRRDAYNLIDTEVGSGRFTDSCRLGLLVDLSFSEKLKECLGRSVVLGAPGGKIGFTLFQGVPKTPQ